MVTRLRKREHHIIQLTNYQALRFRSDTEFRGKWESKAEKLADEKSCDVYLMADGKTLFRAYPTLPARKQVKP